MDAPPPDLPPRGPTWARVFRAAGAAIDARKLLLAALGLVLMRAGWWGLDRAFGAATIVAAEGWSDPAWRGGFEGPGEGLEAVARPVRTLMAPFLELFRVRQGPAAFARAALEALWAAIVWGILGGAIARVAVVQVAVDGRVGLRAALKFALGKARSLIGAPLGPLLGVAVFAAPCALMGLLYATAGDLGPIVAGVLAILPLLAGLVMGLILLGLAAGWPLMHAAIAAEGEDSFDALSRSYAYVSQRPWLYAGLVLLAWGLGAVGAIVVRLFARAVVALALWGLSFGAPDDRLVDLWAGSVRSTPADAHAAWLAFVGLLVEGWSYAYLWTAAAIVYLVLRHDVDGTAWHDVSAPERDADAFPGPEPAAAEEAAIPDAGGPGSASA